MIKLLTLVSGHNKIYIVAIGASPSGKAAGFGPAIQRFESFRPSQLRPERVFFAL